MIKNIIAAIVIGLSISAFFIVVKPLFASIQAKQFDLNQLTELVRVRQDLAVVQKDLETRYRSISPADIKRLNTLLPGEVDNVRLILELERLLENSGMQLKAISTATKPFSGSEGGDTALQTVSVSLQASGQYADFIDFLSRVESGLRLIDVMNVSFNSVTALENVSVEQGKKKSGNNINIPSDYYEYSFTLQTYWLP